MSPITVAAVVFVDLKPSDDGQRILQARAFLVCPLSVAASLFLIVEMDDPFDGMMKISSAPIRFVLSQLGQ